MLQRRVIVTIADVEQFHKGTVVAEFEVDGRTHKVAFNVSDYPNVIDDTCTRESLVSFKFQYQEQGYGDPRIVPGG